jgi:hypothetical protein
LVKIKRSSTNSGVEVAGGDAKQRKRTNCCVPNAQGDSLKSVVPLRSGEVRIASIWWRDNPESFQGGQKPKPGEREQCERMATHLNYCFHVFISFSCFGLF